MEHRDDLEKLLLDGLTEAEREQVRQAIGQQTAKKLHRHRDEKPADEPAPVPEEDPLTD
jgi:hypothetical protein